MSRTPIELKGVVPFKIKGQAAKPKWEQDMLRKMLSDGEGASNQLRFVCRIATDANQNFRRVSIRRRVFVLNPKAKAQFGRNANGYAFLTVGLIDEKTGDRYRLHWEGDNVPRKMQEVAVRHDEGKSVRPTTVKLDLEHAKVWRLNADTRERHDVDPQGAPHRRPPVKRVHSRLCSADLLKARA